MWRLSVFVVVLGVLAWSAVWFADHPGDVAIRWQGYAVTASVGVLLLLVAGVAVLWALIYHSWLWLRAGPRRFRENRAARRRERGYQALTKGLVAVAAGDARSAQRLGREAGRLVENPLNLLLLAQAAQLDGDETKARRHFGAMLEHDETEFLGLRGLIVQATKAGEWGAARDYARRAYALRPETEWVSSALFDLESRAGDWRAAQKALESAARHKHLNAAEAPRRRALVLAERARAMHAGGNDGDALALAREAHKLAPGLVAATALAAELLAAQGKRRAASRLVEDGWKRAPHPDLARAFAAIAPGETAIERVKRFERLHQRNPDHPESRIALAQAALEAELWGSARAHLEAAAQERPTQRVFALLATVEERQTGDAEAVRAWLLRAAGAAGDVAWLCGACGAASAGWSARCTACDAFDSLAWRAPPTAAAIVPREPETALAPAPDEAAGTPAVVVDAAMTRE